MAIFLRLLETLTWGVKLPCFGFSRVVLSTDGSTKTISVPLTGWITVGNNIWSYLEDGGSFLVCFLCFIVRLLCFLVFLLCVLAWRVSCSMLTLSFGGYFLECFRCLLKPELHADIKKKVSNVWATTVFKVPYSFVSIDSNLFFKLL